MGGNADSVVPDGKLHLIPDGGGRQGNERFGVMIAGGILQKLSQNKAGPFIIGIDRIIQAAGLNADA